MYKNITCKMQHKLTHNIILYNILYGRGRVASFGSERDKSFRVNKTPFGAVGCVKKI